MSFELAENETLPSLWQLAKDLKISVLTTTWEYNTIQVAEWVSMSDDEIINLLRLLLEDEHE